MRRFPPAVLLVILATVLYVWIGQFSQMGRDVGLEELRSTRYEFSQDFARALLPFCQAFMPDQRFGIQPLLRPVEAFYTDWRNHAAHPELVAGLFQRNSDWRKWNPRSHRWEAADRLLHTEELLLGREYVCPCAMEPTLPAIVLTVMPRNPSRPKPPVLVVATLNIEFIKTKLLPELAQRFAADTAGIEVVGPDGILFRSQPSVTTYDLDMSLAPGGGEGFGPVTDKLSTLPGSMPWRLRMRFPTSLDLALAVKRRRMLWLGLCTLALLAAALLAGPRAKMPDSRDHELLWTIVLEATLFFSYPTWSLMAENAFPKEYPWEFALTLLSCATLATMLFHVMPASWMARKPCMPSSMWGKATISIVVVGFGIGAASSLAETARFGALMMSWILMGRVSFLATGGIAILLAIAAGTVALSDFRLQKRIAFGCCLLGLGFLAALLFVQWPGLSRPLRFTFPPDLFRPWHQVPGLIFAAAPAAVLGARIGAMGVSKRKIWYSGIAGVWAPLVVAALFASLAKEGGIRLHWVPSLPVGFEWAMSGTPSFQWNFEVGSIAGVTSLGPCIVFALWLKDLSKLWTWQWKSAVILLAVAGLTAFYTQGEFWYPRPSYLPWAGCIAVGTLLLVCWPRQLTAGARE